MDGTVALNSVDVASSVNGQGGFLSLDLPLQFHRGYLTSTVFFNLSIILEVSTSPSNVEGALSAATWNTLEILQVSSLR